MSIYFNIAQIIISVVLIAVILLQTRNSGLGSAFGSDSSIYTTRRGLDQTLHQMTIILAVLFCVVSLASVLFQ